MCILAMTSCSKENVAVPEATNQNVQGKMLPPWIFWGGPFTVENATNCPYGTIPAGYIDTDAFQTGTKNLVINEGTCTIDPNNLILAAGSTAGTYGPYYFVIPTGTPHASNVVSKLKIRVKNVSPSMYEDYDKEFSYDVSTNTWSWSANAPNYFDITTTSGLARCH